MPCVTAKLYSVWLAPNTAELVVGVLGVVGALLAATSLEAAAGASVLLATVSYELACSEELCADVSDDCSDEAF